MTTYVVLSRNGSKGWTEVARVDAAGDLGAIRAAVEGKDLDGDFVAVPTRSFQTRRAVAETRVSFPKVES